MDTQTKTAVPLLDLLPQYEEIQTEVLAAVEDVLASQHFILGPQVAGLESTLAQYCHCDYAVGVSSGTDALLLALMALEIGPGDAVITSPYTFFATAGSIARVGARPLFCDIDCDTYNLSSAAVERLIADRCAVRDGSLIDLDSGSSIKALLPVHLYGQTADMAPLLAIAQKHQLRVIEDAAQAIGAEYESRRAGCLGDIGCFSFFPSKNLGAYGDGGLCTTNDPALAERMRVLRVHGARPKYHHQFIGGNFRLDALQAAVLSVKIKYLDGWTRRRQQNAAYYDSALRNAGLMAQVAPPAMPQGGRHVFNQFVVRAERRDELRSFLATQGIGTEIYYPVPLHLQECFQYLELPQGSFPVAERAAEETLALPIFAELTSDQLTAVVGSIVEFYEP